MAEIFAGNQSLELTVSLGNSHIAKTRCEWGQSGEEEHVWQWGNTNQEQMRLGCEQLAAVIWHYQDVRAAGKPFPGGVIKHGER